MAFQILDDYLYYFVNQDTLGKKVGGDILADKKTFLFIHASSTNALPSTSGLSDDEKIEKITNSMRSSGSDLAAKNLMKRYSENASKALHSLELKTNAFSWFEELLFSVTERVS